MEHPMYYRNTNLKGSRFLDRKVTYLGSIPLHQIFPNRAALRWSELETCLEGRVILSRSVINQFCQHPPSLLNKWELVT